ncbi:hypothetical protein Aduo_010504 [Ancylostoma duodenale]
MIVSWTKLRTRKIPTCCQIRTLTIRLNSENDVLTILYKNKLFRRTPENNDAHEKEILENLLDVIARLKTIEAQMQKMRNECQEREKIWEAVEREVNFLEEKVAASSFDLWFTFRLYPKRPSQIPISGCDLPLQSDGHAIAA